ncbi:MAG: hypothetical protein Q8P20_08040 [bacterium]|nr:hypothetical protein [bacterium]MDZ4227891.1 hypothetical protein [Candidatus Levybacteria bacterium]
MKTKFTDIMGNGIEIRLLKWILDSRDRDYTITQAIELSNTRTQRTYVYMEKLIDMKIIIPKRKTKRTTYYTLNKKDINVKRLIKLFNGEGVIK